MALSVYNSTTNLRQIRSIYFLRFVEEQFMYSAYTPGPLLLGWITLDPSTDK